MALLPIILLFILVLARDRRLIGGLRNEPVSQFLGWGTFVIVTSAVLVLLSMQVLAPSLPAEGRCGYRASPAHSAGHGSG
jgi:hypothetical protein